MRKRLGHLFLLLQKKKEQEGNGGRTKKVKEEGEEETAATTAAGEDERGGRGGGGGGGEGRGGDQTSWVSVTEHVEKLRYDSFHPPTHPPTYLLSPHAELSFHPPTHPPTHLFHSTRHVYLLSPRFLHGVSLSAQKKELSSLLDTIPGPSSFLPERRSSSTDEYAR